MPLQVFRFYFVYMAHVSFSTLTCEETTLVHAITAKIMSANKGKTIKKGPKFRKMAMEIGHNWTDGETERFCTILVDTELNYCATLETKALKKSSNTEVFESHFDRQFRPTFPPTFLLLSFAVFLKHESNFQKATRPSSFVPCCKRNCLLIFSYFLFERKTEFNSSV